MADPREPSNNLSASRVAAGCRFLVGDGGPYAHLYVTSATFKANIDMLIRLMPLWVEGIATNAREADERVRLAIRAALDSHLDPTPSPPERDQEHEAEALEWWRSQQ